MLVTDLAKSFDIFFRFGWSCEIKYQAGLTVQLNSVRPSHAVIHFRLIGH